jgi:hypothetical protein
MAFVADPFTLTPLAYLAGGGALFYGTVKLCEQIEKGLSEDTKIRVALWILSPDITNRAALISRTFTSAFDRVFGTRHVAFLCFIKSCLASLIAIIVLMMFWIICLNHVFDLSVIGLQLLVAIILAVIFNIWPDYVSLLLTRGCISIASVRAPILMRAALTIGNVFACTTIDIFFMITILNFLGRTSVGGGGAHCASVFYLPCRYFQWGYAESMIFDRLDFMLLDWFGHAPIGELQQFLFYKHHASFQQFVDYPKIFFITTFETTLWFSLYILGGFVTGIASGFDFLRDHLDVEEKPLYGIGL